MWRFKRKASVVDIADYILNRAKNISSIELKNIIYGISEEDFVREKDVFEIRSLVDNVYKRKIVGDENNLSRSDRTYIQYVLLRLQQGCSVEL